MSEVTDDEADGYSVRLHRLVDLARRHDKVGNIQRWHTWRDFLGCSSTVVAAQSSELNYSLDILTSALRAPADSWYPTPGELATIAELVDVDPSYFDMSHPRHIVERNLLTAQLEKIGAGSARICRYRPTKFELVRILENVLSIACESDQRASPEDEAT